MKRIFLLSILIFVFQISFAQTKVDEYERTDSDSESIRVYTFLGNLGKEPESKGLIVIYSGDKGKGLAAAINDREGLRLYMKIYLGDSFADRVAIKIIEGRPVLFKEFWIYPKGVPLPSFESPVINLGNLKTNYLYASGCAACEPVERLLARDNVELEPYADLLKRYPGYSGLIVINQGSYEFGSRKKLYRDALRDGISYRSSLVKDYKVRNRISIRIARPFTKKESPELVNFYIIPKKTR